MDGNGGMGSFITRDYGSFPHSLLSTSFIRETGDLICKTCEMKNLHKYRFFIGLHHQNIRETT
jgi:hypothetical protein